MLVRHHYEVMQRQMSDDDGEVEEDEKMECLTVKRLRLESKGKRNYWQHDYYTCWDRLRWMEKDNEQSSMVIQLIHEMENEDVHEDDAYLYHIQMIVNNAEQMKVAALVKALVKA